MANQYSDSRNQSPLSRHPRTPSDLNKLNKRFWEEQSGLNKRRAADPAILGPAMSKINEEGFIGMPLKFRKSFELALAESESKVTNSKILSQYKRLKKRARTAKADAIKSFSRKGGRAPRTNPLRTLIEAIVSNDREITKQGLLNQLKRQVGQGTIVSIGTEIRYRIGDEKVKRVPVSGLKDRLTRAKRKISSR